jgi:hypothetical protein
MGFEHRGEIVEQISGNELEDRRERIAIGDSETKIINSIWLMEKTRRIRTRASRN